MNTRRCTLILLTAVLAGTSLAVAGEDETGDDRFRLKDVFGLEYASDPQIAPDAESVVYVRNFMDIMKDRRRSNLWIVNADGSEHRPITTGNGNDTSPRWSPDGTRLLYTSRTGGSLQLYCHWMDTGQTAKLTSLLEEPSGFVWSPDGKQIAFSMLVPTEGKPFIEMPAKPAGAEWAPSFKMIRRLKYRFDGKGFLKDGYHHLFVLPAEGGTPRQLTTGDFNHETPPAWTPDSTTLVFSANRNPEWEYEPLNSEIYEVSLADRTIKPLTHRDGPDTDPAVSPDGKRIAYVGFDDERQGYQVRRLYVMNRDGTGPQVISGTLDRKVQSPRWSAGDDGLFFQYDDRGNTKVGFVSLSGKVETIASDVGGATIGRPYASGSFSVSRDDRVAFTQTRPDYPADVALGGRDTSVPVRLTSLNADLLGHKTLAEVEAIHYESSHEGEEIHGWIVKPPGFDPAKKYPLILEIHGGPFANYGARFTAEIQLYAAAGYVVLYTNPRGSTGYGERFGNLIHHAYPGHDYDDLMSGVDEVIRRGYVDEQNLFVTGGSGGGVLTSWVVGKTDRFRAAVAAKPVINWYSFVLTTDQYAFFAQYWFPGVPWEHADHYMARSSLSLVGNVTTPTMLITGEVDHRTPISESEQFYQALKLRKVDTALVRVPGSSHAIAARPSNMIEKVAHILKWFETYRQR